MVVLTQFAIPLLEWYSQNAPMAYFTVTWDREFNTLQLTGIDFCV